MVWIVSGFAVLPALSVAMRSVRWDMGEGDKESGNMNWGRVNCQ